MQAVVYLACAAGLALTGSWGLGVGLLAVAGVLTGLARAPEVRAMHLNPNAASRHGPTDT